MENESRKKSNQINVFRPASKPERIKGEKPIQINVFQLASKPERIKVEKNYSDKCFTTGIMDVEDESQKNSGQRRWSLGRRPESSSFNWQC